MRAGGSSAPASASASIELAVITPTIRPTKAPAAPGGISASDAGPLVTFQPSPAPASGKPTRITRLPNALPAERQLHLPAGDNYIAPFLRRPRWSAACSSLWWRGRLVATSKRRPGTEVDGGDEQTRTHGARRTCGRKSWTICVRDSWASPVTEKAAYGRYRVRPLFVRGFAAASASVGSASAS